MSAKIRTSYEVSETHEISVDCNGFNFLVIYGKHINGWFIAIPNWNICTEASHPDNIHYNAEKLSSVLKEKHIPDLLAKVISDHYEHYAS